MKNVIIVDRGLDIYNKVKNWNDVRVDTLVVETEKQKQEVLAEKKVASVFSFEDVYRYRDTFVSKEDIERFRYTQYKVERYMERGSKLRAYNIGSYYSSLAFWIKRFSTKIDCAFKHMTGVEVRTEEFEKTSSRKIKRFLYK